MHRNIGSNISVFLYPCIDLGHGQFNSELPNYLSKQWYQVATTASCSSQAVMGSTLEEGEGHSTGNMHREFLLLCQLFSKCRDKGPRVGLCGPTPRLGTGSKSCHWSHTTLSLPQWEKPSHPAWKEPDGGQPCTHCLPTSIATTMWCVAGIPPALAAMAYCWLWRCLTVQFATQMWAVCLYRLCSQAQDWALSEMPSLEDPNALWTFDQAFPRGKIQAAQDIYERCQSCVSPAFTYTKGLTPSLSQFKSNCKKQERPQNSASSFTNPATFPWLWIRILVAFLATIVIASHLLMCQIHT